MLQAVYVHTVVFLFSVSRLIRVTLTLSDSVTPEAAQKLQRLSSSTGQGSTDVLWAYEGYI